MFDTGSIGPVTADSRSVGSAFTDGADTFERQGRQRYKTHKESAEVRGQCVRLLNDTDLLSIASHRCC